MNKCSECGRVMTALGPFRCSVTGGFCNWHIPAALRVVIEAACDWKQAEEDCERSDSLDAKLALIEAKIALRAVLTELDSQEVGG